MPLGGPRLTWEDHIKIDLREKGNEIVDCIDLLNTVGNLWVP